MTLDISDIERIANSIGIEKKMLQKLHVFLDAINDWPFDPPSLEEFVNQLESFIGDISTKDNLERTLKNIDYHQNAWAAESITQLLELYRFYNSSVSVREIIDDLKQTLFKK